MPATLLGAITQLFDASAAYAAVSAAGGLWVGGVPENFDTLPFVVLAHGGERPDWTTEDGVAQEEGEFEFFVYAVGLAAAEALAAQIKAAFDPSAAGGGGFVQLPIAGATSAWCERQDYRARLVGQRSGDSEWVYEARLPYKSFVCKQV